MTNTLQHLLTNSFRLVCVKTESKGDNHANVVECSPAYGSSHIATPGCCRTNPAVLVYRSDGGTECRGNHPEQLHKFHFGHPYIFTWDVHPAAFADCYNCPFHNHIAIEISLNDWLSWLPNIVKSLSIFSVVILAYFCVVVMFVCPNIRLTLSMGIPLLRARVANP